MLKHRPLLFILLLIATISLQGCSEPSPKLEFIKGEIFRDNFDSEHLADHWIVGPEESHVMDDKWSLTANPGYLTILTQAGDIHESNNNPINFFMVDIPYENFEVTTHVLIQTNQDFEQAGLLLYNDLDNYAQLARIHTSGNHAIKLGLETAGNHHEEIHKINNINQAYFRMSKINDQISFSYNIYGDDWIEFYNRPNVNWDKTSAVLYAVSPISEREIEARFDYIEIQELKLIDAEY